MKNLKQFLTLFDELQECPSDIVMNGNDYGVKFRNYSMSTKIELNRTQSNSIEEIELNPSDCVRLNPETRKPNSIEHN